MKLKHVYLQILFGIILSLFLGCSLSENKAKTIINNKLSKKKHVVVLKVRGKKAEKVFAYLVQNDYIDNVPTKTSMSGFKAYKITHENNVIYYSDNDYLPLGKDPNTGETVLDIPLHIHEHVKKITKITNDPNGKKAVVNYTGQYKIIKSNDRLWSWCKGTETCSLPLSDYLNNEYKAQMTLIKSDKGWR